MIVWLDAQLPPGLAQWLRQEMGLDARALKELGLRDARHVDIFEAARNAGVVPMSKHSDFVGLVQRLGTPPQLVWLTCGNVTNANLPRLISGDGRPSANSLQTEPSIVELGD